jgi:hypothetical protein
VKAVLTTRCGCSREFETTFPPPPEIHIPMSREAAGVGWFKLPPTHTADIPLGRPYPVRVFRLKEPRPTHPHFGPALYYEHATFDPPSAQAGGEDT